MDIAAVAANQPNTAAWAREVLLEAADSRKANLSAQLEVMSRDVRQFMETLRSASNLPYRVDTIEKRLGDDTRELRKDIRNAARIFETFREAVEMMHKAQG
jgi:DNA-binding GntR family transcriptional regulator